MKKLLKSLIACVLCLAVSMQYTVAVLAETVSHDTVNSTVTVSEPTSENVPEEGEVPENTGLSPNGAASEGISAVDAENSLSAEGLSGDNNDEYIDFESGYEDSVAFEPDIFLPAEPELLPEIRDLEIRDFESGTPDDAISYAITETVTGTCGTNLTWTLTTDGTLTISGTGAMTNWNSGGAPWYSYRADITTVIIESGVTSIGNYAFRNYTSLSSITLPEGLTSIGINAFRECTSLSSITIPESVTSISDGVFFKCHSLNSITLSKGVTSIGIQAFYCCTSLSSILWQQHRKFLRQR